METITEKLVERFEAVDDNGNRYKIRCYQKFSTLRYLDGTSDTEAGLKRLETSDGREVGYIDAETFQIFDTDVTIRKV